jgi:hypothetical protein
MAKLKHITKYHERALELKYKGYSYQNIAEDINHRFEKSRKAKFTEQTIKDWFKESGTLYETYRLATVIFVARRARAIFDGSSEPAEKRAFLDYLLQNPTVNGKKLYFSIASPFNLVLELASSPNWLPGQDSNLRPID